MPSERVYGRVLPFAQKPAQFQNRAPVGRGKHFFRRFFQAEPAVGDVFFGLQGDGRITRDFGREEVFAVFKHAFWIAVPPVVVDFVNRAVVPVLKLPVRQQDAGFFPNFAPCRLGDGFARFEAAGYRLPKSFRMRAFDEQDAAVPAIKDDQCGDGVFERFCHRHLSAGCGNEGADYSKRRTLWRLSFSVSFFLHGWDAPVFAGKFSVVSKR